MKIRYHGFWNPRWEAVVSPDTKHLHSEAEPTCLYKTVPELPDWYLGSHWIHEGTYDG